MTKEQINEMIGLYGLVPVIKLEDAKDAVPLAKALEKGGLPIAEITFRTAAAEESIRRVSSECPNVLVGAGTVLTPEQAQKAMDAGAKFIVTPGFNPRVVGYCVEHNIPIIPGVNSPGTIEQALEFGLTTLKFFPAEASGGLNALKAMAAPYGMVNFVPTGGIDTKNLASYLAFDKILACGGSFMVNDEMIKKGDFDGITTLTKAAMKAVMGFEFAHMGINFTNKNDCLAATKLLCSLFDLEIKEGNSSNFAGAGIELMNENGLGTHGHIGIRTSSIPRARAYFERMGLKFNDSSIKKDAKGKITVVYLQDEIGGFGVHLLQR